MTRCPVCGALLLPGDWAMKSITEGAKCAHGYVDPIRSVTATGTCVVRPWPSGPKAAKAHRASGAQGRTSDRGAG